MQAFIRSNFFKPAGTTKPGINMDQLLAKEGRLANQLIGQNGLAATYPYTATSVGGILSLCW